MATDLRDCPKCMDHYLSNPFLVGACASVGIEHGVSTETMLARYLSVFHRNGHRDQTGERGKIDQRGGGEGS